ncbi:MAG TPA: hypothetical protein VK177_02935 [Flavobacteriales bacterium]|nr:hypothetical protein [Flavobacteriales bacterium]
MESFYHFMIKGHSGLRWVALILLLWAIFNAVSKKSGGLYTKGDRKLNMFAMVSLHLQLVIGLILYFISPLRQLAFMNFGAAMKDGMLRHIAIEHITMMILAIVFVTIGHAKSKRVTDANAKHKKIMVFYIIGLVLILAAIPWPFRGWGHGWF